MYGCFSQLTTSVTLAIAFPNLVHDSAHTRWQFFLTKQVLLFFISFILYDIELNDGMQTFIFNTSVSFHFYQ